MPNKNRIFYPDIRSGKRKLLILALSLPGGWKNRIALYRGIVYDGVLKFTQNLSVFIHIIFIYKVLRSSP